MNNIHNLYGLDLSFFHRIDINLYPLFIAIYEQKVFRMPQAVSILRSQQQVMLCNDYVNNLKMMYLYV